MDKLKADFPEIRFTFNKKVDEVPIDGFEIICTYGEDISKEVLERANSLKWLMVASAGVEKMPLADIAAKGIVISNVRGIHKTPMAESALAHILSLGRGIASWRNSKRGKSGIRKSAKQNCVAQQRSSLDQVRLVRR